jgi:hypothetical protein
MLLVDDSNLFATWLSATHALEQTFYLPIAAMADPEQSPLRMLERLAGRSVLN